MLQRGWGELIYMRLLLVHSGADLYGASRSFLRLSSRLVKDGHQVLALLPYQGPLLTALKDAGIHVDLEPQMLILTRERFGNKLKLMWCLASLPRSVFRMRTIIRNFKPDVVHTNTAVTISSGIAARLCSVPHLWHVREFFSDFPRLWPWYQKLMMRFSDCIACVSRPVAEQFRHDYRGKTVVMHNGFPREEFDLVSPDRAAQFRNRFDLNGSKTVGLVGRIKFGRKGQEVFVRAAASIKDRFPDTKFLCIGSPFPGNEEHLDRLQQLVRELKLGEQFIYTGDVEDIKGAYAALDISVLASACGEPFGGVVIESMAMALPVIGTAIGGTGEQIENGVTGYLVPPGDPQSMADAMTKLLASPETRRRFGSAGRERFLAQFEFENFYRTITALYESLAQKKRSRAHA